MRPLVAITLCASAAACGPTVDELRKEPVLWSSDYSQPYDTLTNCIASRLVANWVPAAQVYARQNYGLVTVGAGGSAGLYGEFTVRRLSDDRSQVEFRRRKLLANLGDADQQLKDAAEACGRAT